MRQIYVLVILIFFSLQLSAQVSRAEQAAGRIAQRLTDSLVLSASQKNMIYSVTLNLNNQKVQINQQYQQLDSAKARLAIVENQRDALYQPILTPAQYQLYLTKKLQIIGQ